MSYDVSLKLYAGMQIHDGSLLRQCLRTYVLVDKTAEAETLFRDIYVKPFIATVCIYEFGFPYFAEGVHDMYLLSLFELSFILLQTISKDSVRAPDVGLYDCFQAILGFVQQQVGSMHAYMHACMYCIVCMYACMHVCVYVCDVCYNTYM